MPFEMTIEQVQQELEKVRAAHGEKVYQQARRDLALSVILQPQGEAYVRKAFPDIDVEDLKQEAQRIAEKVIESRTDSQQEPPEQVMLRMIQQQIPSIKTQGHFNLFTAGFDAYKTALDGYFSGDFDRAQKAREALNKVLDTASTVKSVTEKLEEIPADVRSAQANEFLEPPKEFHEYDLQKQLIGELEGVPTRAALTDWYAKTTEQRERVTSQKLRNELFDKIRAKRTELESKEAN